MVLPAPFGPTSAVIVPRRNVMARSSAATMPPKRFDRPRTWTSTDDSSHSRARRSWSSSSSTARPRSATTGRGLPEVLALCAGTRSHAGGDVRLPVLGVHHLQANRVRPLAAQAGDDRVALGEQPLRAQLDERDQQHAVGDQPSEAGLVGAIPIARDRSGSRKERMPAPMTEPTRLAIPPKMTIAKIDSEIANPNSPGVES